MKLKPSDSSGNLLSDSDIREPKTNFKLLNTTCDDWDINYGNAAFKGHTAEFFCQRNFDDIVDIRFEYEVWLPANPVNTYPASKGTVKVSSAPWPTFAPAQTFTSPLAFTYLETQYDPILDADMKHYKVGFWISMTYGYFCGYETYKSSIIISTDCYNMPYVSSAYQSTAIKFTPHSYQPYPYAAVIMSSKPPLTITAVPSILLCYQQCHAPDMGSSPEHIFEYRKVGDPSWISITYTDLYEHDISVLLSGDYEYRSKGLVTSSPDVYSPYTDIQIVTVP